MSLLKRASHGYVWSQAGRLAEVALFFVLSFVLARWIGPAGYGVFALGMSLMVFCGFLATLGIGQETLGKFVPEAAAGNYPGGVSSLVKHLLGVRLIAVATLSAATLLTGRWVERLMGVPGFRRYLGLILLVFALRSLCELFTFVFSGLLELRVVAASRSVAPLIAVAGVWTSSLAGKPITVQDAWSALAIGQFAALLILLLAARKGWPVSQESSAEPRRNLRRVLSFGLFAWLAGFFVVILGDSSDVALIGWLIKDAKAVGFYAVGSSAVLRGVNALLAWLPLIGMSTACNAYLEGGRERLADTAEAVWKLIVISLVPSMLLLFEFSEPFVTVLYSKQYLAAVGVLRVLAAFFVLSAILGHGLQAGILYILDREKSACAVFAAAALFNVVTAIPLIKAFGMIGAAWATGLSFVFFAVLSLFFGGSACPIRWPREFITRVVLASFISCFATIWLKPDSLSTLAVAGAVWVLLFFLMLGLTKPLSSRDSSSLRRIHPGLGCLAERFFARSS